MIKYKVIVLLIMLVLLSSQSLFSQEIGIQLYSLRNQFKTDVEGTLKTIHDWGITKIEGGDTYGMPFSEFKALLDKYNLDLVSMDASFEELESDPEAVAEKAKAYGATYVTCAWIPHEGDNFTLEDTKKAIEVFNRAGELLDRDDIILTYHAHGYEFRPYENGTLLDYMMQQAEEFYFEMDVFWVQHGGADPLTLLNTYPDQFVLMHLKDMDKSVKGNNTGSEDVETNVVLGTGQIDMAAIVNRAEEMGLAYLFIEDESSRVVQQVPKSLAFLKRLELE